MVGRESITEVIDPRIEGSLIAETPPRSTACPTGWSGNLKTSFRLGKLNPLQTLRMACAGKSEYPDGNAGDGILPEPPFWLMMPANPIGRQVRVRVPVRSTRMAMMMWWQQLALVMAGGALGAAGRFWLGGVLLRHMGSGLPWGTLAANLGGAFAVGFLAVWLEGRGPHALYWRAFLIVGILGGLTTFSSLMLECLLLGRGGRNEALAGYLGTTLLAGMVLVWLGAKMAEGLRPPFA